jgi:hypothetical protein
MHFFLPLVGRPDPARERHAWLQASVPFLRRSHVSVIPEQRHALSLFIYIDTPSLPLNDAFALHIYASVLMQPRTICITRREGLNYRRRHSHQSLNSAAQRVISARVWRTCGCLVACWLGSDMFPAWDHIAWRLSGSPISHLLT